MNVPVRGELDASGLRIGIVRSLFNQPVTDGLLHGAIEVLEEAGALQTSRSSTLKVPSKFRLSRNVWRARATTP